MKKLAAMVLAMGLIAGGGIARGDDGHSGRDDDNPVKEGLRGKTTLALYGDWPYSQTLLGEAPLLIDSINSDPDVRLVMHVGDIHSGSMPCTGVGLNPAPAAAVPDWNVTIFNLFEQFADPLVYTPGDNEWTDCQKSKEGSSGYPLYELGVVRSLFFSRPGFTLGQNKKRVLSQSFMFDSDHPEDAQFVENVMWEDSGVVFVTLNVPGSNNDTEPWAGAFSNPAAQTKEAVERSAANLRWLRQAFRLAEKTRAKGVLIGIQADMWDPEALPDGLTAYTPFVQMLADLCVHFKRPVLLINGDSHVYESDQPLADPASPTGAIHGTQAVPNLTRITVEGSTAADEWVKLTVDPKTSDVFSWERIQYLP